jgi:hypothetical protein
MKLPKLTFNSRYDIRYAVSAKAHTVSVRYRTQHLIIFDCSKSVLTIFGKRIHICCNPVCIQATLTHFFYRNLAAPDD